MRSLAIEPMTLAFRSGYIVFVVLSSTEVFNPAPGDPLSWKVYFQPASAHLPAIFKQSWGAWLAASGVFD